MKEIWNQRAQKDISYYVKSKLLGIYQRFCNISLLAIVLYPKVRIVSESFPQKEIAQQFREQ